MGAKDRCKQGNNEDKEGYSSESVQPGVQLGEIGDNGNSACFFPVQAQLPADRKRIPGQTAQLLPAIPAASVATMLIAFRP